MKWTFKLRGKPVAMTLVEGAVAVRPTTPDITESAPRRGAKGAATRNAKSPPKRATPSAAKRASEFGTKAIDDSGTGSFGIAIPATHRKLFEKAGWQFVSPKPTIARAMTEGLKRQTAKARRGGADAIRPVLIDPSGGLNILTDRATVALPPDLSLAEAKKKLKRDGLKPLAQLAFAKNTFEVLLPDDAPAYESINHLQDQGDYLYIEPSILQPITGRMRPTDPRYTSQWQHSNRGTTGGVAGADIRSELAWDVTRGKTPDGRAIRIAVIDNGFHVHHPDLKAGIVGGGHFRSGASGWADFIRFRPGDIGFPTSNHGTFCLGMAGARMNNDRGGCGSAPESALIPIACLDDQVGTQTTLARAIAFAADPSKEDPSMPPSEGADVISASLGPNGPDWLLSSVLEQAILFATTKGRGGLGTPIFWAVSNGAFAVNRDEICSHPAVIAVGRSNRSDLQDGSAFGPELEFLAPGRDVYSTSGRFGFDSSSGSSFAAPLAAGVAALTLATHQDWTAAQLRERLRASCDKIGGVPYDANGHHPDYGYGRINATRAVTG